MKKIFRFILKTSIWFVVLSVVWALLYKVVPVSYTPLMAIRYMEGDENYQKLHDWVSLDNVSTNFQLAVVCAEDQKFLEHNGFDIKSIKKAYKNNRRGGKLRGGSTISQQTAKNVFLWPKRDFVRKGLESWFTFLIENLWSKERILEVYMNSIEMGDGVYGIEAAAQHWFQKRALDLTKEEAAAIAAILPNPREYRANPRSHYMENRKKWIINQMRNFGTLALKAD
jgi:monofunctional biosynthetic peptidoglycan transglycosylase